jgi:hypothetical protein
VAIRLGSSASGESSRNDVGGVDLLSVLAISRAEARMLGRVAVVERLVENGSSRLTAERFAALEFGTAEPGRARFHSHARR